VTEVCHENASRKSVTKLPQKTMLREFAKASEAEIWTRVRRRYFTSSAGIRFKNEPGLTELDAVEGRRNRMSRRIRRSESANRGLGLVDKWPTLASVATKE